MPEGYPPPVAELVTSWDAVSGFRLARQRPEQRAAPAQLLEVVRVLGGLHAQLMSSAELTLWARTDGLPEGALSDALWERRSLVKTWAMRGTLHVLPSSELGLWQVALSERARRHYLSAPRLRMYGMTQEDVDRLLAAIGDALGGEPLTRLELAARVEQETGSAHLADLVRESWGGVLKPAAAAGLL